MTKLKVYLAGPISGKTYAEAVSWRQQFRDKLKDCCEVLSPMRDTELLFRTDEVLGTEYNDFRLTISAITARDRFDVTRTDVIVANFLGAKSVSIGTILELGWADILRKPIILIMEENNIHQHGMIRDITGWIVGNYKSAIQIIRTIAGKELP